MEYKCGYCEKKYKNKKCYQKHQESCNNRRIEDKPKKKRIPSQMRYDIWEKYVGKKLKTRCFCCYSNYITPFTGLNTFQAGHILSEFNGGKITIDNLLPICKACNSYMGTMHWDDFVKINNYPIRVYGRDIPLLTIKNITLIQRWWREIKKKRKICPKKKKKIKKKKKRFKTTTFSSFQKLRKKSKIIINKWY